MYVMYSGKVIAERISWQPHNISVYFDTLLCLCVLCKTVASTIELDLFITVLMSLVEKFPVVLE